MNTTTTTKAQHQAHMRALARAEKREWSELAGMVAGLVMLAMLGILAYSYYTREAEQPLPTTTVHYQAPAPITNTSDEAAFDQGTTTSAADTEIDTKMDMLTPDATNGATTTAGQDDAVINNLMRANEGGNTNATTTSSNLD